jgi:hypothetical protein
MRDRFEPLRNIPLTAVLRACGARPDRYDKAKWYTTQGTLSITGTKLSILFLLCSVSLLTISPSAAGCAAEANVD